MNIPICIITGRIAGDSDACGDCDPCSAAHCVPDPVKRLLAEKDEWREKYSDAMGRIDTVRASCGCVFCDLELDPEPATDGTLIHSIGGALGFQPCTRPPADARTLVGTHEPT